LRGLERITAIDISRNRSVEIKTRKG
jgi:hypothetical protein